MSEIYLVNHRPPSHEPFKSIMRLPKAEAFTLAAKLNEDTTCSATYRFGKDFANYYADRIRAEEWLYSNFTALGGKPQTKHPLYFYVNSCEVADDAWPAEFRLTEKILLASIDSCDITFIFGDSCERLDKPDRLPLFMKDELTALIATHGSIENLQKYVKQQIGYDMIEAHLWSDKYNLEEMTI